MPIGHCRIIPIKRSEGFNVCQKSAYYGRNIISFEGSCALDPKIFDFRNAKGHCGGGILLPKGVDKRFKDPEVLWNHACQMEKRQDSQEGYDGLVAIPNDKELSYEEKEELFKSFLKKYFVEKGFAVQWDIHYSETDGQQNLHGHFMFTGRLFREDGKGLEKKKPEELIKDIFRIKGQWPRNWEEHQNAYFKSKGLSLRVDPFGIIPQEHLGPVRMRGRAFALMEEHVRRLELNTEQAKDPSQILKSISFRQSVFTKEDVERFCDKHTPTKALEEVKKDFWKQEQIVELLDKKTQKPMGKFSTHEVIAEEDKLLRLSTYIHERAALRLKNQKVLEKCSESLSIEQKRAYQEILSGPGLACIQGYAGTGKSRLLKALSEAYSDHGINVRAFGPDNATAKALKEKGIPNAENVYRFLFAEKHGKREIAKHKEVWLLDEAGKIGNKPLLELFKLADKKRARIVLSGDQNQLPSIDRGGIFKNLCNTFSYQKLEEVWRHEKEEDRKMNIELSRGEIGAALDRLSSSGRISWSETRREAMENLMAKWAFDNDTAKKEKPSLSDSLIISASRKEVKCFNEIARSIRKTRGEIESEEFSCRSIHGDIFISKGDVVEFRKNNREICVMNGDRGVLVSASKEAFYVSIKETDKKTKLVSFDPKTFHGFQLGYATTTYKSQGETVGSTYVMHSPAQNRQMAYVSLTRHQKDIFYFVSKDEASSLSELKRQARRDQSKRSTLDYTNPQKLAQQEERIKRESELQELRKADNLSTRLKGTALQAWESIKKGTSEIKTHYKDVKEEREFFESPKEIETTQTPVHKISPEESTIDPKETARKILANEIHKSMPDPNQKELDFCWKENIITPANQERPKNEGPTKENANRNIEKSEDAFQLLTSEQKDLVESYREKSIKANEYKELYEAEKESLFEKDTEKCSSFALWQKSCGARNQAAYNLRKNVSTSLRDILGENASYVLQLADRHEKLLDQNLSRKQSYQEQTKNLSFNLSENIEPLLYKLFPEGPNSRSHGGWRFGNKGSLAIKSDGRFFDHEKQEGGGALQLIQRELNLEAKEAKEWAKEFLGLSSEMEVPRQFKKKEETPAREKSHWISLKPPANAPSPGARQVGDYVETARYAYKDEKGELLHYVLRLEDKEGNKITPPISYGYDPQRKDTPHWKMKGFDFGEEKKTLYHLEALEKKPLAPVLVVEGEKTADAGAAKLKPIQDKDYIALTWHGGCQAVSKTDWTPLAGRDVLIWPDNDKGGFLAAKEVERELLRVGAKEIKTVDQEWLQKDFEQKWDLADPWPKKMTDYKVLRQARGIKMHNMRDHFLRRAGIKDKSFSEKCALSDLASSYLEGRTENLEKEFQGKEIFEKSKLLYDAANNLYKIFQKEPEKLKRLSQDPQINASGDLAKHLARQCTIFEIKSSREPNLSETLLMKETIEAAEKKVSSLPIQDLSREAFFCVKQRTFEKLCDQSLERGQVEPKEMENLNKELLHESKELSMAEKQEKEISQAIEKQQEIERQIRIDRGPSISW